MSLHTEGLLWQAEFPAWHFQCKAARESCTNKKWRQNADMRLLLRKGWFYQSIPGSRKYSIMNALGHVDNDTLCSGARWCQCTSIFKCFSGPVQFAEDLSPMHIGSFCCIIDNIDFLVLSFQNTWIEYSKIELHKFFTGNIHFAT